MTEYTREEQLEIERNAALPWNEHKWRDLPKVLNLAEREFSHNFAMKLRDGQIIEFTGLVREDADHPFVTLIGVRGPVLGEYVAQGEHDCDPPERGLAVRVSEIVWCYDMTKGW